MMHMSLPPGNAEPATDARMRGVLDRVVGRNASRAGSTCGVPGASVSGFGAPDDGLGVGAAVGVRLAVGAAILRGVAGGRGDGLIKASWLGFGVGEGEP